MKKKTIDAVITKKMTEWLESVEDEKLRKDLKHKFMVTGGCIASMLLKEKINDFDIYLTDRDIATKVAKYYVERFKLKDAKGIHCNISVDTSREDRIRVIIKSAGVASEDGTDKPYQYFEGREDREAQHYVSDVMTDPSEIEDVYEETQEKALEVDDVKYRPIFMSTNAITLSGKIQIILRFYGDPAEIHENYDFVHCTNYWTFKDGVVLNQAALESILARELRYIGSKYPICSLIRIRKFIKRNWTINAGQVLKACMQISKLDLTDVNVLEEQLTGVDVAYFMQLISYLKDKDQTRVDYAYLVEIIDRMF